MARISIIKEATVDPFLNNVSLLLPFDGSFNDASNNNFAVTDNGNAQISSAQSKFGGSSAFFDGNGDYLVLEDDADFNLASTPFTIEAWIYPTLVDSTVRAVIAKDTYGSNFSWCLAFNNTKLACYTSNIAGDYLFEANASVQVNTWQHIAVTSDGTTQRLFLNGQLLGTKNAPITNALSKISIGCFSWNNPGAFYQGYIDDLRVTKGFARYTSNFTPPNKLSIKSGKLNIQRGEADLFFNNVSLLLPMDTSFNDLSSNNFTLTTNGDAEIRTDQTKFGDGAGYFGPSSDYLTASSSPLFGFGTGDFTIEMWIYPQGTNSFQGFFNANDYTNGILMRWHANSVTDSLYINSTAYNWQPAIYAPVNTWSHIALVRYGGTVKMFVNGVNRIGSVTNNSNIGSSAVPLIGASAHNVGEGFNGYIDDLRVTKGLARYTADFTPPNSSFSAGKGGKVNISKPAFPMANLLAFWKLNDTSDSSGNGYNLTNNGGVQFVAGKIGNCAEGDTTNYLNSQNLWTSTSPLPISISFWVNPTTFASEDRVFVLDSNADQRGLFMGYFNGSIRCLFGNGSSWAVDTTLSVDTMGIWSHYAATITSSGEVKIYKNGVEVYTQSGLSMAVNNYYLNLFRYSQGGSGLNGKIDAVGIWNRPLTLQEIQALYNNGSGVEP
jgi:hypothetical protein